MKVLTMGSIFLVCGSYNMVKSDSDNIDSQNQLKVGEITAVTTTTTTNNSQSTTAWSNSPKCPQNCTVSIFLPNENCCKFWQCHNGVAYLFSCPDDLYWSPTSKSCDWPVSANCSGDGSAGLCPPCPSTTKPPSTTTTTKTPTKRPNCPQNCPIDIFLSDCDCSKFWQCSSGVAYLKSCPHGLQWNPNLNLCDWPQQAGCTGQAYGDGTPECPQPARSTTTSTTMKPENTPPCPRNCENSIFIPNKSCTKYWLCSNGKAYERSCPVGLEWNPLEKACDWSDEAGCTGEGWCDEDLKCPPTTKLPSTTPTPRPVNSPSCDECIDGDFFQDSDCTKYWRCSNGIAHLQNCPEELNWNPNKKQCDWPELAGCTGEGWSTTNT
ncbi:unnamed protein product [Ceutorhynchus assimilis]|uniref:Chitin-binding type-2 domain-containing protein n=1 Tax=Ceutorhynchus assimilis TaxID=467358 RepID=A0A9N9MTH0_9CUCU|nr:unnamed protein product [Ceutorhynchus assimilis]